MNKDCDKCKDLKKINWMLTEGACLELYSKDEEHMVSTDADTTGLEITLWQKHDSRRRKSIAQCSRYLNAPRGDTQ